MVPPLDDNASPETEVAPPQDNNASPEKEVVPPQDNNASPEMEVVPPQDNNASPEMERECPIHESDGENLPLPAETDTFSLEDVECDTVSPAVEPTSTVGQHGMPSVGSPRMQHNRVRLTPDKSFILSLVQNNEPIDESWSKIRLNALFLQMGISGKYSFQPYFKH